ncbi:MAG: hypothetical protein ACLGH0_13800 [Thermoanaerobaculia bacterium]
MKESITGIPADQVTTVVQDFINDGATVITVERNEDGTFTVSAAS